MLELDAQDRPDFKELLTKMPEYELVMEHFDIEGDSYVQRQDQVPKKRYEAVDDAPRLRYSKDGELRREREDREISTPSKVRKPFIFF